MDPVGVFGVSGKVILGWTFTAAMTIRVVTWRGGIVEVGD